VTCSIGKVEIESRSLNDSSDTCGIPSSDRFSVRDDLCGDFDATELRVCLSTLTSKETASREANRVTS